MSEPCACGGSGATTYREEDGATITVGSRLCECRLGLPPRDGRARWWSLEPIFSGSIPLPVGDDSIDVDVSAEVPISAENFRLVRRGNRYWPTLIDVEVSVKSLTLFPDDARKLAAELLKAADACDLIDLPDTDLCGHWAPCDCRVTEQATA